MSKTKNHKNMSTDERINVIRKLIGEINISRYDQKTYRGIVNEIFFSVGGELWGGGLIKNE